MRRAANEVWVDLLRDVLDRGSEVSPRGEKVRELIGYRSRLDMTRPVVTVEKRKLSRKFLAGEAYWILTGDSRLSGIAPYNSAIAKFSDDGRYLTGSYGPKVVEQIRYVVDCLVSDHDSRQAVMTIWRENPRPSKDIPCTISVQWFLRKRIDDGVELDEIHCVDTMRSSDAWLGFPYDAANFAMLTAMIALTYQERTGKKVSMGELVMQCGSQHIYERNWDSVDAILSDLDLKRRSYEPFKLSDFSDPDELLDHLRMLRDGDIRGSRSRFLEELL